MEFKNLDELYLLAKKKQKSRLVIAAAHDRQVLQAVNIAWKKDIVEPILVGQEQQIREICKDLKSDAGSYTIIHESDPVEACHRAVSLIKNGKADILMKGIVPTAPFLKAILNKETGIKKREVLSHIALFEIPGYHKLLAVTDAAMNIHPNMEEKVSIIQNAVEVFHRLGQKNPKIAVIGPVEVVNEKIESTIHASMLTLMNQRGQITGCLIDGPLALDNAVNKEAADHKGITSEVAGDADIILAPDLNSGNILYKSLIFLAGSISAAIVMGAVSPVVLTSRADSEASKLMSVVLAAALDSYLDYQNH